MRAILPTLALAGIAFLCTGCAFGNRHVTLEYPSGSSGLVEASTPSPRGVIVLGQFSDERDTDFVGEVCNGFGMHTADVEVDASVSEWVRNAVRYELEQRGFAVVDAPSTLGAILSVRIAKVFCTAFFTYKAEVTLFGRLENRESVLFDVRYSGEGSAGVNWAATGASYGQSLVLALEDALQKLMNDVEMHAF
ncbi:MAG: YajG family lipoprotein [Planctomycetota bacterium]|jgi:hypothetical protein